MAKKTNPKLIGGFVLGALILAIVGALAFGGTAFLTTKVKAVLFFQGSLAGLDVGAPVQFRGVNVGTVTDVVIQYDVANQNVRIPVHIEIEPEKFQIVSGTRDIRNIKIMVERGLRAQLVVQSLVTGQAVIEFDFHPDTPIRLVGREPNILELPTIPSGMDVLKASLSDIMGKISKLPLEDISAGVIDALQTADDTLKEIKGVAISTGQQIPPLSNSFIGAADKAQAALAEAKSRLELRDGEPLQNLNAALVDSRRLIGDANSGINQLVAEGVKTLGVAYS
ncbi:MAG: MlaD family protein, partial [Dongiaceae bacterium]